MYHTQRELLRERTRCKALEEELENPMNIHRWRKLEVIWRILIISFKTGKPLLSIYNFFSREVIQVRTKWSKRFKLYKDDLYRRLKRFVWYVVSLFRAHACVRARGSRKSKFSDVIIRSFYLAREEGRLRKRSSKSWPVTLYLEIFEHRAWF